VLDIPLEKEAKNGLDLSGQYMVAVSEPDYIKSLILNKQLLSMFGFSKTLGN
jgi:hypothetical protein